jgi:regulator of cell morphogenesis and NO signaling
MAENGTEIGALIERILETYHEPPRRELPELRRLAGELGLEAVATDLVELEELLELHMFKEEMRLFPMMEQGSSGLLGHLVDDMMAEHRAIEALAGPLAATLDERFPPGCGGTAEELGRLARHFFSELEAHASLEDEILFAPFAGKRGFVA